MKWILTYLFPIGFAHLISLVAISQDNFSDGINAYNQKDYALAVSKFEKVLTNNPNNTSAWYNLGLSNVGLKSYGNAIWNFEKVLKYIPNDSQVEEKIAYCYNQMYPDVEWQPRLNSFESSLYSLSPNTWSLISIVLSVLSSILLIFYFTRKKGGIKSAVLALNVFVVCCLISSLVFCSKATSYYSNENFAVVTSKSIPTFIGNSASPTTKISEGNRVEILFQEKNGQVTIETSNGERHIVFLKDLNII